MIQEADQPFDASADDHDALLRGVVDHYHRTLLQSGKALAYLERRGLSDPALVARFRLGFADRSLGKRLRAHPSPHAVRVALAELGVLRESGHEHLNGSIVVPVLGADGHITELYGRKIGLRLRDGTPLHSLTRPGPRTVFHADLADGAGQAILCHSIFDALSFWTAGQRAVIACHGPGDFGVAHIEMLQRHGVRRVLVAFRRTAESTRDVGRVAEQLMDAGFDAYAVEFPLGQDANDALIAHSPGERFLPRLAQAAVWIGQGAGAVRPLQVDERDRQVEVAQEGADSSHEEILVFGQRRYRVRGLDANLTYSALRVNVMVSSGDAFHVDTLDLYSSRQRTAFIRSAAGELHVAQDVIKSDLGRVLLHLEEIQDRQIRAALSDEPRTHLVMHERDRDAALSLLRDPRLIERVAADFARCGVIGERANLLVTYLAATSRKLEQPLAVVIQSSTASGKSALMKSILDFMPEDELVHFSALTAQSLYYLGEHDLTHRILAIAEETGAERAAYPLKLLQSEGTLSIATTGKDLVSGRIRTFEYRVEGPVMILLTTAAMEVDEELRNRCIVLAVNEDRDQTRAIQQHQRHAETLEGLLQKRERAGVRAVHRNAQRLLKTIPVVNPYAEQLTFLSDRTRTRRDHLKYLTLIRAITLLHQYQRPTRRIRHGGEDVEYLEVQREDIALANELVHQVMGRSLDELAPQTRRLLELLQEMQADRDDDTFCRRNVIAVTGWSYRQVQIHLRRLVELEYVLEDRSRMPHRYELLLQRSDRSPVCIGLLDVDNLRDDNMAGCSEGMTGALTGHVPALDPLVTGARLASKANGSRCLARNATRASERTSDCFVTQPRRT